MKTRPAKIILALSLIAGITLYSAPAKTASPPKQITARQIVDEIKTHVTCPWRDQTCDTFKAGDPDTPVTGIATTFIATLDVLKRAKAARCNLIITHEPTWYHHGEDKSRLDPDPVIAAKEKFIEQNNLVVWRFHDHIHANQPDGIIEGMVDHLGWRNFRLPDNPRLFKRPKTTLRQFARDLKDLFPHGSLRVVGNPDMTFTRFGYSPGASGTLGQMKMLQLDDVEVLVAGETCEWETVEYVRDAVTAHMNKALIVLGHANSEEAGMKYCAAWLKNFITDTPVQFIPAKDPFWEP